MLESRRIPLRHHGKEIGSAEVSEDPETNEIYILGVIQREAITYEEYMDLVWDGLSDALDICPISEKE